MKRWNIPIVLILVLALILPAAAAGVESGDTDVFAMEIPPEEEYHGFLVRVTPDSAPSVILSSGISEVVSELYMVESLDLIQKTWGENDILYIEPNYTVTLSSGTPNDPLYSKQWEMSLVNAPAFWASGITCDGVRIGVIDSGISYLHEDLDYSRIAEGYNYIDENTNVKDLNGHGTSVTGLITAKRNNGLGVAGLLSRATIVPLKTFGHGSKGYLSDVVRAIWDAVDTFRCDVINMSLTTSGTVAQLRSLGEAVSYAASKNVLLVASVGNDGTSALKYPAAYDTVVGVGSVDSNGGASFFSQRNSSVFVTAPGRNVYTLTYNTVNGYSTGSGTSFAAPFVTAMAAIAKSQIPNINTYQFMDILKRSATDKGAAGYDTSYGYGTVNLQPFLDELGVSNWPAGFQDVPANHWAVSSIIFVKGLSLFAGTTPSTFSPEEPMTRAMFVTVLGRVYENEGGIVRLRNDPFIDTTDNAYYSRYVAWAAEAGIVAGIGGGRFDPDAPVTRQEGTTFLYRFASYMRMKMSTNRMDLPFIDVDQIAPWALDAMAWATESGLLYGINTSSGLAAAPTASSTRAQVAALTERFVNIIVPQLIAAAA